VSRTHQDQSTKMKRQTSSTITQAAVLKKVKAKEESGQAVANVVALTSATEFDECFKVTENIDSSYKELHITHQKGGPCVLVLEGCGFFGVRPATYKNMSAMCYLEDPSAIAAVKGLEQWLLSKATGLQKKHPEFQGMTLPRVLLTSPHMVYLTLHEHVQATLMQDSIQLNEDTSKGLVWTKLYIELRGIIIMEDRLVVSKKLRKASLAKPVFATCEEYQAATVRHQRTMIRSVPASDFVFDSSMVSRFLHEKARIVMLTQPNQLGGVVIELKGGGRIPRSFGAALNLMQKLCIAMTIGSDEDFSQLRRIGNEGLQLVKDHADEWASGIKNLDDCHIPLVGDKKPVKDGDGFYDGVFKAVVDAPVRVMLDGKETTMQSEQDFQLILGTRWKTVLVEVPSLYIQSRQHGLSKKLRYIECVSVSTNSEYSLPVSDDDGENQTN